MPFPFDPVYEGGPYTYTTYTGSPSGIPASILGANPNRIAIIYTPSTNFYMAMSNSDPTPGNRPLILIPSGETTVLKWEDYGPMIGYPWWHWQTTIQGISGGAVILAWSVTEVIYRPTRT